MQGRDLGRSPVRPRGLLRLRRRHAAVRGRAGGRRRLPHRRVLLLLPVVRRRRSLRQHLTGAAPRAATSSTASPPSTRWCRSGASCSPIWSRRWPPSPASSATSPGSCSSRSSTASAGAAGRSSAASPLATLDRPRTVRIDGRRATSHRRHPARRRHPRRGRGHPRALPVAAARRAAAAARRPHRLPRLRRRPRGRAPARRPRPTTAAIPTPCCRSSASWPPSTTGASGSRSSRTSSSSPSADAATLDAAYDDAVARLDQLAADGADPLDEPLLEPAAARRRRFPRSRRRCATGSTRRRSRRPREHIFAGDVFQVVLSQRFDFDLDAEPFDVYRVLRQVNPSPYMYYVRVPGVTLVGAVARADGAAARRPGHLPADRRHPQAGRDRRPRPPPGRRAARAPQGGRRAHHAGRPGPQRRRAGRRRSAPCEVDEMMTLERYSHVMHLTSQVVGRSRRRVARPIDVLRATLPAGTVSGAPKVRAMEIIDELEPVKRGPYAGVVGYLDFSGNIDTAIAIRTMVIGDDGRASVQAGAGIVADSGARRRGPRVPEQGPGPARRRPRRPPHDRRTESLPMSRQTTTCSPSPTRRDVRPGLRARCRHASSRARSARTSTPWRSTRRRGRFVLQPQGKVDAWLRITKVVGRRVPARRRRRPRRRRRDPAVTVHDPHQGRDRAARLADGRGPGRRRTSRRRARRRVPPRPARTVGRRLRPARARGRDPRRHDVRGAVRRSRPIGIARGMPAMGAELDEGTIPAEVGQWIIDASVSFTKGCFVGQELVARIDSRGGNVPRHLRAVVLDSAVAAGTAIRSDGPESHVTSVARHRRPPRRAGLPRPQGRAGRHRRRRWCDRAGPVARRSTGQPRRDLAGGVSVRGPSWPASCWSPAPRRRTGRSRPPTRPRAPTPYRPLPNPTTRPWSCHRSTAPPRSRRPSARGVPRSEAPSPAPRVRSPMPSSGSNASSATPCSAPRSAPGPTGATRSKAFPAAGTASGPSCRRRSPANRPRSSTSSTVTSATFPCPPSRSRASSPDPRPHLRRPSSATASTWPYGWRERQVDNDGIGREQPVANVPVRVNSSGWTSVGGDPSGLTDADGVVVFSYRCDQVTAVSAAAVVGVEQETFPLAVPPCAPRPTTTTTTTTAPGRGALDPPRRHRPTSTTAG